MVDHISTSCPKLTSFPRSTICWKKKCKNISTLILPSHITVLKERVLRLHHRWKLLRLNSRDTHRWSSAITLTTLCLLTDLSSIWESTSVSQASTRSESTFIKKDWLGLPLKFMTTCLKILKTENSNTWPTTVSTRKIPNSKSLLKTNNILAASGASPLWEISYPTTSVNSKLKTCLKESTNLSSKQSSVDKAFYTVLSRNLYLTSMLVLRF